MIGAPTFDMQAAWRARFVQYMTAGLMAISPNWTPAAARATAEAECEVMFGFDPVAVADERLDPYREGE